MPTPPPPWYRQFWPWFLLSLPALAIVGSLVSFWLAAHSADALVVDDYYKQGKAINRSLARAQMAANLQWRAELHFPAEAEDKPISLRLRSDLPITQSPQLPAQLILHLVHPTQAERDQTLFLRRDDDENYTATQPETPNKPSATLDSTRWQLQLEDAQHTWRMQQTMLIKPGQNVTLTP